MEFSQVPMEYIFTQFSVLFWMLKNREQSESVTGSTCTSPTSVSTCNDDKSCSHREDIHGNIITKDDQHISNHVSDHNDQGDGFGGRKPTTSVISQLPLQCHLGSDEEGEDVLYCVRDTQSESFPISNVEEECQDVFETEDVSHSPFKLEFDSNEKFSVNLKNNQKLYLKNVDNSWEHELDYLSFCDTSPADSSGSFLCSDISDKQESIGSQMVIYQQFYFANKRRFYIAYR